MRGKCALLTGLILLSLLTSTAQGEATVQISVFCRGGVAYDTSVTVGGSSPTALDAIKASGIPYTGSDSGWGFFLTSIGGCGGSWGPAFFVNGGEASAGVSSYVVNDGDHLQFIGPNDDGPTAGYLYISEMPAVVAKGKSFRIRVMERSAYSYGGYDRPSSGASVTIGNKSATTGSDGYTPEIELHQDAYYCVGASKSGYVASYYISEIPYIQAGIGGTYICAVTGEGLGRANIKYDESSLVRGQGFAFSCSSFENAGGVFPDQTAKVYQQGSGNYSVEKAIRQRPTGIDSYVVSDMSFEPVALQAGSMPLKYSTRFEDVISQRNYPKGATFEEKYRDLNYIHKESSYNNSDLINISLDSNFKGMAEIHTRTVAEDAFVSDFRKEGMVKEEFSDVYIGSFHVLRRGTAPIINKTAIDDDSDEDDNETYSDEYELPCLSELCANKSADDQTEHSAGAILECPCSKSET